MIFDFLEIPQLAVDAGKSAMKGAFRVEEVSAAVSSILRPLHDDSLNQDFDYEARNKDAFDKGVANTLVQNARRKGLVSHIGNGIWNMT